MHDKNNREESFNLAGERCVDVAQQEPQRPYCFPRAAGTFQRREKTNRATAEAAA